MPPSPKPYSPEELEELKNTLTEEEFAGMFDENMVDDPEEGAEFDEGEPEDADSDAHLFADQKDIASDDDANADQADENDENGGETDPDAEKADEGAADDDSDTTAADTGDDPDGGQGDDVTGEDAAPADDEIDWPEIPEPPKFETKEAPEALKSRAAELERSLEELAEKHDEGEITSAEFTKESRKIQRELGPLDIKLANATVSAEDANALAQKHWGETTVPAFLDHFPEYRASQTMLKTLDQVVREIQMDAATDDPIHPDVLKKAHAIIVKEYPWKFAKGAKAKTEPAEPEKPADGGKKPAGVKPAAQRQMPPTLARVPAAEHEDTADNSRWAAIDRLDGVAYEDSRHFDEHKVMTGFANADEAIAAYRDNYAADWNGLGDVTETTLGDLKQWFKDGNTTKPFADRGTTKPAQNVRENIPEAATVTKPVTPPATSEAPAKPKKKAKAAPYLDRLQNWFRPGRVITGTYGTDRVVDFARGLNGQWSVTVIATDAEGNPLPREQERTHQTAPDRRELDRWERNNPVGSATAQPDSSTAEAESATPPPETSTTDRFASNTLFTADKVAAARARLKSKMSQLNSGIDPEVLLDGMTIAGAYIEAGVRDFSQYASQMAADFGDGIRPFLLSFWEATRHYPGLDTTGMTSPEDSARLHAAMTAEPDSANVTAQPEDQTDGGTQELDTAGAGSLERAPADAIPAIGEGRQARASAPDSGRDDLFGDRRSRAERDRPRDGLADGAGDVSPAASRDDGTGSADAVQPDPDGDRGTARDDRDATLAPGSVDASQSAATPAQDRAADIGFTITDADQIGTGGQKTKFKNNVAAIRLLRTLEEENRPATASEQRVLAKWVGWGGLPQAFYRDGDTASKGWEKEAAQLKELLTDEEYAAARASTQNAHYTSPEVVKAVWSIAERLGFRGGQVLEPSVGAGNFLGLMPAGARKGSRITGVELDHITGGIARNLYPAANIQAPKGFQDVAMPDDIEVKPGSPWVPANHVADFANHITNGRGAKATYYGTLARWDIDAARADDSASLQWGTDRATVGAVLDAALNDRTITITNRMSDGSRPVDVAATEAANEKVARVKDEWRRWLWQDDARRAELARLYNDTFNTDVLRVYDGAHLSLPGKVGDDIIELRPHQKSFVWRAMQSGTVLGDHTVGAGKTFAAIAAVMEKRRIGQWKKPVVVVPNHLVGQWAADFVKLYPGARILAATKKDFEKANRKRFFARMATGDWDAVIVAHSSFGRIGVDRATQEAFINEQIDDIDAAIDALRQETGRDGRSVKQVEAQRDRLKEKLKALYDQDGKDAGLTFDEIGIDGIVVDEAHEFKNLGFATSMTRVAGLGNPQGSQKAADLHMKIRVVKQRTGGQNVMFLTGTPISNTMAEMFTVQRYLDEESLKTMGIAHFDAWARVFGEVVTDWELSPAGKYQMKSRFSRFANIPELMTRYRSFADVISNDDIKRQLAERGQTLPLPKVKGGKPENVVVERSADQAAFIGEPDEDGNYPPGSLVWRAENLPKKVEKGSDNMLKVMSDARKAALDMRLIDPSYGDDPNSKVHQAADRMKALYDRWHAQRGTQLVFIDLSTPKAQKGKEADKLRALIAKAESGDEAAQEAIDKMSPDEFGVLDGGDFSVYDDLRQKLVDRDIPDDQIAFIHDANTDLQKEELFGKVRSGRVRFLFGSTAKMGAGTNVQNRLVGLHNLDAPWRPSDLEQREGRGIRQGNELYMADPDGFEIEVNRYATKLTLDSRMWQTIEQKARFIGQIRAGSTGERIIEDIGGEAANAAEMKAAASGNPLILEEMDLRQKLRKLDGQSREHDREQFRIADRIRTLGDEQERTTARLPAMQSESNMAFEALNANVVTIAGAKLEKPKDIGDAILKAISHMIDADAGSIDALGSFGGFELSATHNFERNATLVVKGEFEHEIEIADIREQDDVGLGMKLRNTLRSLVDAPLGAESRLEQIGPQIEKLEAQRGEFGQAEELFQVRQRHQAVLDQLKPKKQEAAPAQPAADESGDPSLGWDSVDGGPESSARPTDADIDQVRTIIQQVAGLDDVAFVDTIPLPEGAPGWGSTAPSTAGGMYQAARDVITIALDSASDRVAYHEAFHRLQHLFLTDAERAVLKAERGKLRRMVRADEFRRGQVDGMSQKEIEAEAFAIYAAGKGRIRPHNTLAALWDRIRRTLDRARSYLAGRGFQTVEDIYDAARAGRIAARQAVNVQTSRLPAEFMARPVLRLTGQELGVAFSGPQDMPALRRAARAWYDKNLRGTTATMADGTTVGFNRVGLNKSTFGGKGDILLRSIPAIRSIIENGRVVQREPGNKPHIRQRIVVAAPVELDGTVHPLAVSIHENTDGTFQYDFTFDRSGGVDFTVGEVSRVNREGSAAKSPLPSLDVPLLNADGDLNIGFWPADGNETSYNVNPPTSPAAIARDESRMVQEIKGKLTDIQPSTLSLVPLNYFTELKQDNMTAVDDYLGIKRALDAYRGKQHAKSDAVAQKWLKYVRAGVSDKGKAKAAELAGIMHDATLAGVDPSKSDPDSVNHPSYAALRARYMKLSPSGRALFGEVRDTYRKQQLELDAIILDNVRKATEIAQKRADEQMRREIDKINRSKLNDRAKKDAIADAKKANSEARTKAQWSMKARLTRLRQTFEASRVPAPYFPLGRFGRYYVVAKDVNGEVLSFSKRETAADRDRLANQLRRDNPTAEITEGVMDEMTSAREAMDPRLVAEIEKIVGGLGIDASSMAGVLDQIWQRYLETMPDLSIRKRYIHRKCVAGFDEDALRVFSSHMFHAAHQMGRLKYGMELNELVNDIARQGREADNSTKGVTLANEMRKRHDWVMNPKGTRAAQTVNSLAFVWYLGLTPAAALVNMSQTPILGIPILAGRFGSFPKAAAALLKASKDSVMGRGLPSNAKLPADEQKAMEAFYNTGLVDRTQSHDLAGVGDTGVDYGPLKARVMEVISFMFHRAEVWNREVTALAAYRMAKAAGQDWTQAVNTAHDLTWKTHFDYSNSSRPRIMQNDFAKVALVFRAHSINMLYRLARDTHQSFAGATPQARREARRQLAGIYGMMAVSAGVTGVPAFHLAMMILGMVFGDDDDPFDFEARFKQSMLDTLGPDLGGVVLNGVPGHLTGTDLTARIGMPDLWFRSPNRDLEGKEQFEYYLFNLLGASTSLAGSMFRGVTDIAGGDVRRGIENMVPKWARDLMRTQRYATEGLTSFQGDEILPAEDFAMLDLVNQAIGFTPARVSEAWQRSSDLKNAERRIYDRRQKLIAQYAMAQNMGDRETMQRVLERIHAFNAVPLHRATRITPQSLKRSLRARASARARRQDGVYFRNEDMGRQLTAELPERVY